MTTKLNQATWMLAGMATLCLTQIAEAQFARFVTATDTPLRWLGTVDLPNVPRGVRGVRSAGAFAGANWNVGVVYDGFELLDFFAIDDIEIKGQHSVAPHPRVDGGTGPELVTHLLEVDDAVNVGPMSVGGSHGLHSDLLRANYNDALGRVFIVMNHDAHEYNRRRIDVNPDRSSSSLAIPEPIEMLAGTDLLGPLQVMQLNIVDAMRFDLGEPQPLDVQIVATDSADADYDGVFAPGDAPGSFMQLETFVNPGPDPLPQQGLIALRMGLHDIQGQPQVLGDPDIQMNVAQDQQRFDAELVLPLEGIGEQRITISGQIEAGQQIAFHQVQLQPTLGPDGAAEFDLHVQFTASGQYDPASSLWRTSVINDFVVYGDLDGNDIVNGDDLSLWSNGFGTGSEAHADDGDFDGDGNVDGADFLSGQRHFGATLSDLLPMDVAGFATLSSVPEPATGVLLAMAVTMIALQRRQAVS